MIMIFDTLVLNDDGSRWFFSVFENFDLLGCYGGKRAKNGSK